MKKLVIATVLILLPVMIFFADDIKRSEITGKWRMKKGTVKLIINFSKNGIFKQKLVDPSRAVHRVNLRQGKWQFKKDAVVLIYDKTKYQRNIILKVKDINGMKILAHKRCRIYLRKIKT